MREFGNYPFDLLFYISFVATITLINFLREIYIYFFICFAILTLLII